MGGGGRNRLNFADLDEFKPRPGPTSPPDGREAMDRALSFPSREGVVEGQINIKGSARDIERFRAIAKRDGLRLIGLLRRALDAYEREIETEPPGQCRKR